MTGGRGGLFGIWGYQYKYKFTMKTINFTRKQLFILLALLPLFLSANTLTPTEIVQKHGELYLEEKYKDALNALSCTSAELRHDHISRSVLSGIFTEAALKFAGEWPLPCPASEEKVQESDKQG